MQISNKMFVLYPNIVKITHKSQIWQLALYCGNVIKNLSATVLSILA